MSDFLNTLADGARALAGEESRLRRLACSGDPRVQSTLHDVAALRERLEATRPDAWDRGEAAHPTQGELGTIARLASRFGDADTAGNDPGRVFRDLLAALQQYAERR